MGLEVYLTHATIASTYGVAGSLVVLLLWVYYTAQILFFGAEFTANYFPRRKRLILFFLNQSTFAARVQTFLQSADKGVSQNAGDRRPHIGADVI